MHQPWAPEHVVTPERARALIEGQFPDLAPARVEPMADGWDNTALLVNDGWVFRFPRRSIAVGCLETELRLLPQLAGRLPLPVPDPVYVGRPADGYPWPFAGHALLPGRSADVARLSGEQRHALAAPLGRFLAAVHAIDEAAATTLGAGAMPRPPDMAARTASMIERARRLAGRGLLDGDTLAGAITEAARPRSTPATPVLVHGDLYCAQLIVDDAGRLAAVIDWGDAHAGDCAVDLMIVHTMLPAGAHEAFWSAYGAVDDETWWLARWKALDHALVTIEYGRDAGIEAVMREGLHTISLMLER